VTRQESAETAALRHIAERERLADERELLADRRDSVAEERELLADQRELAADARERANEDQATHDTFATAPGAAGSRLRMLQSARRLEAAQAALERSYATLARDQVAVRQAANAARQQDLTVAREMQSSKVAYARRDLRKPADS
jgi:hypothetical protein